MSGSTSYHAGLAAEDSVARDYTGRGYDVVRRRWRGRGGEVDLILRDSDCVVFVEVKKSRSFAQAAHRVSRRQMDRLCTAACDFVSGEPTGQLTPMRFDVALVNGTGQVAIIENAFMAA